MHNFLYMPMNYSSQRIGVFVDVQNLYYSARAMYEKRVNFAALLEDAVGERDLIRAFAYVVKTELQEEQGFFDALSKAGYELRVKDIQVFFGGKKKGDWDVGIAMDTIRLASKLDTIVLVSGDGDYEPLIEHLQSLGCRVEVMAFGKSASSKLKEAADLFIDLSENLERYLMESARSRAIAAARRTPRKEGDVLGAGTVREGIVDFGEDE